jgi:hypothetical protein
MRCCYKFQVPSSRFHVRSPVAGALLVVAFEAALLLVGFFCPVAGDFYSWASCDLKWDSKSMI